MLIFANPWFLLLLALVPPLVWWWLRRERPALRVPETASLARLPRGRTRLVRWTTAGMRVLALTFLILALAGPRIPDLRTRIATEGVALQLVVDVSGSMAEQDYLWNNEVERRIDAVKRVLELFIAGGTGPGGETFDGRPDDLIGVITFASRPETACPLTLSHSALRNVLEKLEPKSGPQESQTNIGDAIVWGLHRLDSAGLRRKVMVLLTDGEHNVPPPALKPRQAAQLAAALGVPIHVIDARGERSAAEPTPEGATPLAGEKENAAATLQAVAGLTRGRYFAASDARTLVQVCQEIDRLERREIQSFLYRRHYDLFPWFGLAALLLLVGVQVLESTIWRRLP